MGCLDVWGQVHRLLLKGLIPESVSEDVCVSFSWKEEPSFQGSCRVHPPYLVLSGAGEQAEHPGGAGVHEQVSSMLIHTTYQ